MRQRCHEKKYYNYKVGKDHDDKFSDFAGLPCLVCFYACISSLNRFELSFEFFSCCHSIASIPFTETKKQLFCCFVLHGSSFACRNCARTSVLSGHRHDRHLCIAEAQAPGEVPLRGVRAAVWAGEGVDLQSHARDDQTGGLREKAALESHDDPLGR